MPPRDRRASIRKGKKIPKPKEKRTIEQDNKDAALQHKILGEDNDNNAKNAESFLKLAAEKENMIEGKKDRLSKYNFCSVTYLINGEAVEFMIETIPSGCHHAFHKYFHVLIVLMSITASLDQVVGVFTSYTGYGGIYVVAFSCCMILFGIPALATTLFIGARFRGHVQKIYTGFLGITIVQYCFIFVDLIATAYFAGNYLRSGIMNLAIPYPLFERCYLPFNKRNLSSTYDCISTYKFMDLEIVAAMGINMTLSIIMFLAVICLSGSLYSWWKTGLIILCAVWSMMLSFFIFVFSLDGAIPGFLRMFEWPQNLTPKLQLKIWMGALFDTINFLFLGSPLFETIARHSESSLPIIKTATIVVFCSFGVYILFPAICFMLYNAMASHYCVPWSSRYIYCSNTEKKELADEFFEIKKADRFLLSISMEVTRALKPEFSRLLGFLFWMSIFASLSGRLLGTLFTVVLQLMKWKLWSKFVGWRFTSYIVVAAFPLFYLPVNTYIMDIMSNTALYHLPKICPSSMFIIQLFIFIAVYWVYGSHNVLNDLYLSERRIGVAGLCFCVWCQYVLPGVFCYAIYYFIPVQIRANTIDYPLTLVDNKDIALYCFVGFYASVFFVPMVACCGKFKQVKKLQNMRHRYNFPQLKLPKVLAFILCARGACKKEK